MGIPRIAVGQISSESNHFVSRPCELDFFRQTGFLYEGDDLFRLRNTGGEIGGILSVLRGNDAEVRPLLAARANSAGPLSASCYGHLRNGLLDRLKAAGPVDGVILSHHGSMAAVTDDDTEGDIVAAVREVVGPLVPVVITLDLHGNVTPRMVRATDAILGYEQYPHADVYETGGRAARLLLRILRGEARPAMAMAKLPMLLTAFHGTTQGDAPFAALMQRAKALEPQPGLLSASLFFVGSYIDVPDIGCSAVVIADQDLDRADMEARRLAQEFWDIRRRFDVQTMSVAQAVTLGRRIAGAPVLLLDTADTTGGGASGDGAGLIRGLMEAGGTEPALAMVVDPEAVRICIEAGTGSRVKLSLGHMLDPRWGAPVPVTGEVRSICDGRFQYTGGILAGSWASMGPSVVLAVKNLAILVMSRATYDWADEQYRAAGLDPRKAKFVGVKNMMNFRYGYGDCMKGYFILDLPGPTPPDMRMLNFQRVGRPIFPLEADLTQPAVRMASNRRIEWVDQKGRFC